MPPELSDVDALLFELFETPAPEWPVQLERLCAANPRHADEMRRRYELLRTTGLDRAPEFERESQTAIPERLGEFRLRQRLGSGGMGMVFAAEQASLGREVAIKVVRPELLFSDGARERFRREIEAVARLEHPAIVPVLTHGEDRGVPYYVMPLVRGCSCDEAIRRLAGRDPAQLTGADLYRAIVGTDAPPSDASGTFTGSYWQACVRLMRQVALGLHHAHCRGIVHRDVKPSNILLTADGRALIVDFGLAHVRDDARITRTGATPGSPAYMSPEQVRGQASDARADVYSLAVTLQHLLGLACPFPIDDAEILRTRILAGRAEPLRSRSVPVELTVVLAAAMDLDPARRHTDAQALADDLQAVLERRPIGARPLSRYLRLSRWRQRHPALATGLGLGLLLLAGTPTVVAISIAGQRDRARAAEVQARLHAYEANIAAANTALQAADGAEARRRLDACPQSLRGFEWRCLDLGLDGSLRRFDAHSETVTAVALTDDAARMASGDARGNLFLWQPLQDAGPTRVVLPTTDVIIRLAFADNARRLIVIQRPDARRAGEGGETMHVVDPATAGIVATRVPTAIGERLCLAADGGTILLTRSDFNVDELDLVTLHARRSVQLQPLGGAPPLNHLATDGTWLFAVWMNDLQAWRLADGRAEVLHGAITSDVRHLTAFGSTGACATKAGLLRIETEPLRVETLNRSGAPLWRLAPGSDGRFLAGVGDDSALRVFDLRDGQQVTAQGAPAKSRAVAVACRRMLAAVGGEAGTLQLFGMLGSRNVQTLIGHSGIVAALASTPAGTLLSGSHEPAVRAWDPRSGLPLHASYASRHWVNTLAVAADGRYGFATYSQAIVRLRLPDLDEADVYTTDENWILRLAALPDGRLLAAAYDRGLVLLDFEARTVLDRHQAPGGQVLSLARSADGRQAFTGEERAITRWRIGSGLERLESTPIDDPALALACTEDGATLFASEGTVLRARAADGGRVLWEKPCSKRALCLWLMADGSRLVSGHDDGTVGLWDPADGRCVVIWHTGTNAIRDVVGDRLGHWIAAASEGTTITLFRAAAGDDFAGRLAQVDAAAAMYLDGVMRHDLSLRSGVLAALAADTDLDAGLRRTMEQVERLRPAMTWEAVVNMLHFSSVIGQPPGKYEHALRVAEAVLAEDPGHEIAGAAAGFACLRLGRPEAALRYCEAVLAADHEGKTGLRNSLRATRIMALAALERTEEARAELAALQQTIASSAEPDADDLRLLAEAQRAVTR